MPEASARMASHRRYPLKAEQVPLASAMMMMMIDSHCKEPAPPKGLDGWAVEDAPWAVAAQLRTCLK